MGTRFCEFFLDFDNQNVTLTLLFMLKSLKMSTSISKSLCGFARFDLTILDLFGVKKSWVKNCLLFLPDIQSFDRRVTFLEGLLQGLEVSELRG